MYLKLRVLVNRETMCEIGVTDGLLSCIREENEGYAERKAEKRKDKQIQYAVLPYY
jgi:hypothetical protein